MSFDIEELKIKFSTNIKNSEYRIIEFKRSMLYHPEIEGIDEILNDYPYFTADLKYPISRLRFLTYAERVTFFFNKEKFNERLTAYSKEKNILDKTAIKTEEDEEKYYKQREKNIEKNIMIMIEVLFPTKFPVINDIQPSYDYVFDRSKLKRMILNPRITKYFSYLKLGETVYTFKKTIWINDILNHPVYQTLISQYRKFWIWAGDEKFKYRKILSKNYPELPNAIKELATNENYKTEISELLNLFETTITYETGIDHYKLIIEKINKFREKCPTDCANFFENASVRAFTKALELYQFVESLFEKTFDEVNQIVANLSMPVPSQYNNFAYSILGRYRSPERESSNFELQELINGSTSEKAKEFYDFMEYVYNKFIFVGVRKQPKNNERFNALMNVGLSFLNINTTEGVRREVYVYADFIKGEVDDKNKSKIFCPYVSDHLGNEFEFLVRMAMYGKVGSKDTKRWNIDRNRMIFSISESKSENAASSTKPLELEAQPLQQQQQEGEKQLIIPQPEKRKNLDVLPTYFISNIIAKSDGKIPESMKEVNKIYPNDNLYDQTLLPYIKKNNPELYDIVEEWNENIGKKNFKLIEKMVGLKSKFGGENISLEFLLKDDKTVLGNIKKQSEIKYKITKNNLYIGVLDELIKSETVKQQVVGGFYVSENNFSKLSRKLRSEASKYTRKLY
jgi:hypothetical protein